MKEYKSIKLKSEVVYQLNDDGMMVYVPEEGMVHALNLTAADVVLYIEQGTNSLEGLVEKLLEKYIGIGKKELSNDVKQLIDSMEELGILGRQ